MIEPAENQIPIIESFIEALYEHHGTGCCLHIAIDDENLRDGDLDFCIRVARERGHPACEALARLLRSLSQEDRETAILPEWLREDPDLYAEWQGR